MSALNLSVLFQLIYEYLGLARLKQSSVSNKTNLVVQYDAAETTKPKEIFERLFFHAEFYDTLSEDSARQALKPIVEGVAIADKTNDKGLLVFGNGEKKRITMLYEYFSKTANIQLEACKLKNAMLDSAKYKLFCELNRSVKHSKTAKYTEIELKKPSDTQFKKRVQTVTDDDSYSFSMWYDIKVNELLSEINVAFGETLNKYSELNLAINKCRKDNLAAFLTVLKVICILDITITTNSQGDETAVNSLKKDLEELRPAVETALKTFIISSKLNADSTTNTSKATARITRPILSENHVYRPGLTDKIESLFTESQIVYITGISGSGKSELAREYAVTKELDNVTELYLPEHTTIAYDFEEILAQIEINFIGEPPNEQTLKNMRKNHLVSTQLIILHNFNYQDEGFVRKLQAVTSKKILITSQLENAVKRNFLHLECDSMNKQFCLEIFKKNIGCHLKSGEIESVVEILNLTGYHPYCTQLVATTLSLAMFDDDITDKVRELKSSLSTGLDDISVYATKDHSTSYNTPLSIIRELFRHFELTKIEEQILFIMSLQPSKQLSPHIICALVGDDKYTRKGRTALYQLISKNIVVPHDDKVSIHALTSAVWEAGGSIEFYRYVSRNLFSQINPFQVINPFADNDPLSEYVEYMKVLSEKLSSAPASGEAFLLSLPITLKTYLFYVPILGIDQYLKLSPEHVQTVSTIEGIPIPDDWKKDGFCIIKKQSSETYSYHLTVEKHEYKIIEKSYRGYFNDTTEIVVKSSWEQKAILQWGLHANYTIHLPKCVDGVPVTEIASDAFNNHTLLFDISIPSSIKIIGDRAFKSCFSLKKLHFGVNSALVEIGAHAFERCHSLRTLYIPEKVKNFGIDCFAYCGLKRIDIPDGVVEIPARAFFDCKELRECKLPQSLIKINNDAFANTSLESVFIPKHVNYIGYRAFSIKVLMSVEVDPKNKNFKSEDGVLYEGTRLITFPAGRYGNFDVPENIVELSPSAFENTKLSLIRIPGTVKAIPDKCFMNSENLETVMLADGVTEINMRAFYNSSIEYLCIPKTVEKVAHLAFEHASIMVVSVFKATDIDKRAFSQCDYLAILCVRDEDVEHAEHLKEQLGFRVGVSSVTDDNFYECVALAYYTAPIQLYLKCPALYMAKALAIVSDRETVMDYDLVRDIRSSFNELPPENIEEALEICDKYSSAYKVLLQGLNDCERRKLKD